MSVGDHVRFIGSPSVDDHTQTVNLVILLGLASGARGSSWKSRPPFRVSTPGYLALRTLVKGAQAVGRPDRIADPWGTRTPYGTGEPWPQRVDQYLAEGVTSDDVDRWVQSAA